MTITAYIKELLYTNECVIVPNLGGFVTNYKPAQLSPDGRFIYPPAKNIGFNAKLKLNDGLLVNFISQKENISYEQAKKKIDEFVSNVFLKLDSGQTCNLDEIGTLVFDKEYKLIFTPSNTTNYNIDAFGLDVLSIPGDKEIIEKQKTNAKSILLSQKAKLVYLSLPILIMLSIIGVNKINTSKNINFSSFSEVITNKISDSVSFLEKKIDSLTKKEYALYYAENKNNKKIEEIIQASEKHNQKQKQQQNKVKEEQKTIEKNISEENKISENKSNKPAEQIKKPATKEIKNNKNVKKYYLIAGSFKTEKRAQKQINRLKRKGLQAELIKSGNKYRISIGNFTEKTVAKEKSKEYKKKFKVSSWLLRQ